MTSRSNSTITWYVAGIIVVVIVGSVLYQRSERAQVPIIFSSKSMLDSIWQMYKIRFLEKGTGRTMDLERDNMTTSEGEAYTMLRAVWLDDHATFDTSWKWTEDNLQKQGYLFSWLFGKRSDGSYGIMIAQNGQNTASDADTDIALALAFGFARWRDPHYLAEAKVVITDIWNKEVIIIRGKPYLASDNVEHLYADNIVVNPSYFAPYAYRIFAVIDPQHDWNGLVDTSYSILDESMKQRLGTKNAVGLPPDWALLRRTDATLIAPAATKLSTDYSFDALRVPWRIALDWYWYHDLRARDILASFSFLDKEWHAHGKLASGYGHDGAITVGSETPAMYGGAMGAFTVMDPQAAKNLYETKVLPLFNPDSNSWNVPLSYYDDNWAWFGIALYNGQLPNLWATVQ